MLQAEPEGAGGLTSRAKDLAQGEARAEGAAVEALGTPTWVLERTITAPRLCWPHTPPALFFLGLSVGSGPRIDPLDALVRLRAPEDRTVI